MYIKKHHYTKEQNRDVMLRLKFLWHLLPKKKKNFYDI